MDRFYFLDAHSKVCLSCLLHIEVSDFDVALYASNLGSAGVDKYAMELFVPPALYFIRLLPSRCECRCSCWFLAQT